MKPITLALVSCCILIVHVNSQTAVWSSWADCAEPDGCFRRKLTCDAGEGLECLNEADGAFEQRALNCDASPDCLENVTQMFHASEVSSAFKFALSM